MTSLTIASETRIADNAAVEKDAHSLEVWQSGQEEPAPVLVRPLREVAPGPWRSLGRYLDYTNWPERERFVELDRAIETNAQMEQFDEVCESGPISEAAWAPEPVFSPALLWGVRPIGGGYYRRHQRRRVN